jgi:hypothetical protein
MVRALFLLSPLLLLLLTPLAQAAPEADLWQRWTAHDPASDETIDHQGWSDFIDRYRRMGPEGVARIDYGGVEPAARRRLQRYIDRLADVAISEYNRAVQRAYWINLYNAVTVDVILEHYPVDSIRAIDVGAGWFGAGPWDAKLVEVEGTELSLNDIEHRILRPIWADARIHYAVNCASIGCPNLQPTAFTAANSERLLDKGARAYINHPRGAAIQDGELVVSSIYAWFQADFGGDEAGVIEHLRQYAGDDLQQALAGRSGYADHRYDWSLNDTAE